MPVSAQIKGKLKFYSKPYGRQWKWRFQKDAAFYEKPLIIPKALQDKNIEIIDPLHPKPKEQEKWLPPRRHPALENFFPKPKPENHKLYHEKPIMFFNKNVKFHAGIDQACLLTKTMPVYNLPDSITSNSKKFITQNESSLVQTFIKQALAFNPTKELCSGVEIPKDVKFRVGREYATSNNQQMAIILDNCIRLCNSMINNKNILSRKLIQNTSFYTTFQRADETIHMKRNGEFTLYSKDALNQIANAEEIEKTSDYKFIDMYPIFPTVDLLTENIYEENHNIGWFNNLNINNPFKYVHTIFHINDDTFSTDADLARLIMFAFGYAHAQAQLNKEKLELDSNLILKKPIVLNAISMQNQKLNFITYQLNTLNLKKSTGIKNIVYIDKDNELYLNRPNTDNLPYPSRRNLQRYALRKLEYNSNAFDKLKSLVLYDALK